MPNYRYRATDAAGNQISGEIAGPDLDATMIRLRAGGIVVEKLIEIEVNADIEFEIDEPTKFGPKRLSKGEMVELVEHLASLTKSGVPLASGLRAAANEMISSSLRLTFLQLAARIESGQSLDQALTSSDGRFPAELRGLILAGSRSGRLADLLSEFVRSANLGAELRRMFWTTLLYPSLTLIAVLAVAWFTCSIAVNGMDNIFRDFGVDVPGTTRILLAFARFVTDHGTQVLLFGLLIAVVTVVTIRFSTVPARRREILCSIPLVGPILRFCSLTEFCHRLAMLLEAELPLPLALELAGSSVGDAEVADACDRIGRAVERGEPLSRAVNLWIAIPAGLDQLLRWSEDRRSLPSALHMAGDMFEARARSQSSFARSALSTGLLLLIFWWVGFAVAALFLPMISLISRLSG